MSEVTTSPKAALPRSPRGRRFVAVVLTLLTGAFVGRVGVVVYQDTFPLPPPDARGVDCATGLRRHHEGYRAVWELRREGRSAPAPDGLDRSLRTLRGVCEREGPDALGAWRSLERWRHRAEAMALVWRETLDDDARAALAYQPPGMPR